MNTIRKNDDDFLAGRLTPRRMEMLLVDWANTTATLDNIGHSQEAISRLIKLHPEFFAEFFASFPRPQPDGPRMKVRIIKPTFIAGPQSKVSTVEWVAVEEIQTFLRLAWETTDLRRREWFIFAARRGYYQMTVLTPLEVALDGAQGEEWKRVAAKFTAARYEAPPLTSFERIMYHFLRIAEHARRCANPECSAPYFLAPKKAQKYCTSKCSAPSQREQKRRWWTEHRAEMAKKRRKH